MRAADFGKHDFTGRYSLARIREPWGADWCCRRMLRMDPWFRRRYCFCNSF